MMIYDEEWVEFHCRKLGMKPPSQFRSMKHWIEWLKKEYLPDNIYDRQVYEELGRDIDTFLFWKHKKVQQHQRIIMEKAEIGRHAIDLSPRLV